jgi:hypothetical protein
MMILEPVMSDGSKAIGCLLVLAALMAVVWLAVRIISGADNTSVHEFLGR